MLRRIAVAAAAFFLLIAAAPPPGAVLVRLSPEAAAAIPAGPETGFKVVGQLRSSVLAVAPRAFWASLTEAGVAGEILDGSVRAKKYFLVLASGPEAVDRLKKHGTAIPLDERTVLFSAGAREAREVLPAEFRIQRLRLDRGIVWNRPGGKASEPPAGWGEVAADSRITAWVAKVSKTNLTANIQTLQNFQTRYTSTAGCTNSGTALYNRFVQMGLPTAYESFSFNSGRITTRNVIATLKGKKTPSQYVIVCAHYDSYSNKPKTLAPGADDNASSTAAVLEIARILASASFEYSVKFICFSAEEWGLYGSDYYARRAKSRGEKIIGVINMDMIAYTDATRKKLELYVNSSSNWLGTKFQQSAATYAPMAIAKYIDGYADWSDHWSFWNRGYYALCGIESAADWNPYYHRTTDTIDKLNKDFCTAVTKAALATTAVLAKPYTPTAVK